MIDDPAYNRTLQKVVMDDPAQNRRLQQVVINDPAYKKATKGGDR